MLPRGIADHASTLAMLITRPNMWFGTIAWRRLPVLMLKRIPSPLVSAHMGKATQYQCICENTIISNPSVISDPSATVLKDQRLRSNPADSERTTIPILDAE